jgi:hypothetical protein
MSRQVQTYMHMIAQKYIQGCTNRQDTMQQDKGVCKSKLIFFSFTVFIESLLTTHIFFTRTKTRSANPYKFVICSTSYTLVFGST